MKKKQLVCGAAVGLISLGFAFQTFAEVDGITRANYKDYVKPIADEYGYNKGECELPYLEGEEYFYSAEYDHWNVDKVYDPSLLPEGYTEQKRTPKTPKTDREIALALAKKSGLPVKMFNGNKTSNKKAKKLIRNRKNRYVLVEKITSRSLGKKWGKVSGKYKIKYNKKVKKGKKVVSYIIYNPKTSAVDDVLWVVDNKTYR